MAFHSVSTKQLFSCDLVSSTNKPWSFIPGLSFLAFHSWPFIPGLSFLALFSVALELQVKSLILFLRFWEELEPLADLFSLLVFGSEGSCR
jgi:hypothetical protein